eukprot:jgi/Mesvir1/9636/Mv12132-RA.1
MLLPSPQWADMLKQHTTSTTSAVAAQLKRQTLDVREEAELAKRSLNVIVKNFTMEEGETSEKLLRAFEREILGRMGLNGEIELAAHRLPRARGLVADVDGRPLPVHRLPRLGLPELEDIYRVMLVTVPFMMSCLLPYNA